MKKNACVVRKNDYECYSFVVPFGCLIGKKRDRFIFKELEKLHPCFSDDCCFDSKIVFKKRNFFANVLVMDKLKFSEYRCENLGASLRLEENEKVKVFCERKKWIWCAAVLFALFCAICVIWNVKWHNRALDAANSGASGDVSTWNVLEDASTQVGAQRLSSGAGEGTEAELAGVGVVCTEFVEKVFLLDGVISSFLWECDFAFGGTRENVLRVEDAYEKLNLMVEGIFPESLSFEKTEILINAIKYENNRPKLNVSCSEKVIPFEIENVSKKDFMQSVSNMRTFLLKNCVILEEGKDSCFYRVQVNFNNCSDFFIGIADVVEREKLAISRLQINKSDFFDVQFEIVKNKKMEVFEEKESFNLFRFVGENAFVFLGKDFFEDLALKKKLDDSVGGSLKKKDEKTSEKKDVVKKKNYKQIGKVMNEDGSVIVYYKTELGKIVFEVED